MANNKDLNKIAAAGLRIDRAYNPEEGTITYGGYNAAPKQTTVNGTSGATSPTVGNTTTGGGNTMTGNNSGLTGVRNAMVGAGLDNSKIGWNDGYVTYDGTNFMKPANVTDGTSYASQADFEKALGDYMNAQGMTGVRGAMTGAGFDNDKIGWNDGYVTYNGANIIKPSVLNNGTSYASQADINKAMVDYYKNQDMLGIRETLNARGITNDRIGWNPQTGNVTIDGKDAFKPSANVDGTTYAQAGDINKLTDTAYANSGDPIQLAKQYAAQFGLQNAVHWADGKLTIGGLDVPVMYNQDGNAYARQSDIDKAIAQVKANSGIVGNKQVYDNWKDEYGDRIDAALDLIMNRDKWSYDPDKDPAYLAYRDMYTREGNRAYQDAYAAMAANTGGYGSSAGMTAAGQQLNYYMQQLGDRIPELEQNDYNRWYNDQLLNREAFNSLITAADSDYNKAYQANRDAINDTNKANYYNYLRDIDARNHNRDVYESDRDFNRDKEVQDREWPYQEQLNKNAVTQSNIDTQNYARLSELNVQTLENEVKSGQIANTVDEMAMVLQKYAYGGDYNKQISPQDAAILGISPRADGTYPTIMDVNVAYTVLEDVKNSPYYQMAQAQQTKEIQDKQRQQRLQTAQQLVTSTLQNGAAVTLAAASSADLSYFPGLSSLLGQL